MATAYARAAAATPWRTLARDTRASANALAARLAYSPLACSSFSSGPANTTTTTTTTTTAMSFRSRPYSTTSSSSSSATAATTTTPSSSSSSSSPPRFSFHIAASFIGKDRPYDPSTHVFHFNPYNRIQPPRHRRKSMRPDSGHDAFFVSRVNDSNSVAFGVADGVGGWVDSGVDPADFSHGFCDYMAAAAYEHSSSNGNNTSASEEQQQQPLTARRLMQKGYDAICRDSSLRAGGSTACVAVASPSGNLDVANLGDSGFMQLRLSAVHAHSEAQTHAFNTPFQLSLVPPAVAAKAAAFGGAKLSDLPRDADVTQHQLRHGDVVVLATDGVLDNLFNQEILRIANQVMVDSGAWVMTPGKGVRVADDLSPLVQSSLLKQQQQREASSAGNSTSSDDRSTKTATLQSKLATEIVQAAKWASVNTKRDGPFAKEVKKYFPNENWRGGKVDDICVVALVVTEEAEAIKSKL